MEEFGTALQFGQLNNRTKQLDFKRSEIHGWGLFAGENIQQGEMVVQYVGEIVRQVRVVTCS